MQVFDLGSYCGICEMQAQDSAHHDPMGPWLYMGASPRLLYRQPIFSADFDPCREHCRALVQAFSVLQAGIKHFRTLHSENMAVFSKPFSSFSTALPALGQSDWTSFSRWRRKQCELNIQPSDELRKYKHCQKMNWLPRLQLTIQTWSLQMKNFVQSTRLPKYSSSDILTPPCKSRYLVA